MGMDVYETFTLLVAYSEFHNQGIKGMMAY